MSTCRLIQPTLQCALVVSNKYAILTIVKTTIVIFGITGDLAGRKLLPALSSIVETGNYDDLSILGVSRRKVDVPVLLRDHPTLVDRTKVFTMDLVHLPDYSKLRQLLEKDDADEVLFYLSVPPGAAATIVDFMGQAGLTSDRYRVLFEKPFGYDYESAKEFIKRTGRYYKESQLYRIDHYMAKEIAAEIIRMRRIATGRQHHWDASIVKEVRVVASEAIGVEGRATFYEQTGALRDFIQGHLMQMLSLVLVREPGSAPLQQERLEALQLVNPADPAKAVRGQYKGYQEEVGNPGSTTETFAMVELESVDAAWAGVPLRLISGKALSEKRSYVEIKYKDGTSDVFEEGKVKVSAGERHLDAYERVLLSAIAGDKDIFTTGDEVLQSWEILAPVQEAWSMEGAPMHYYEAGMAIERISGV